jgi:glycosyltransferase involved in cell wall biosynthesis
MLSIIIPALNEEKYLPRLLESIRKQHFEYEVIVADSGSHDQTQACAKGYDCLIVRGGKPAEGRNAGARLARGEHLLFLDADVVLPDGFLKQSIQEITKRKLEIATCRVRPISHHYFDKFVFTIADIMIGLLQKVKPAAHGFCIFSTRSLHDRIKGFDETITFGEDADYVSRAAKYGKFAVISPRVEVSVRRFEKEGRLRLTLKYIYLNLRRLLGKEIREPVSYHYGNY